MRKAMRDQLVRVLEDVFLLQRSVKHLQRRYAEDRQIRFTLSDMPIFARVYMQSEIRNIGIDNNKKIDKWPHLDYTCTRRLLTFGAIWGHK